MDYEAMYKAGLRLQKRQQNRFVLVTGWIMAGA